MRNSNDIQPLRVVQPSEDATDEPDETISVEGHKPLVPEGEYLARYIGHETAVLFSRAKKVALRFEICEGPYQRTRLTRYYRAQQLIGKPGPGGRFQLSAGGDLYRMLARVLDVRTRPDRISVRELRTDRSRKAATTRLSMPSKMDDDRNQQQVQQEQDPEHHPEQQLHPEQQHEH